MKKNKSTENFSENDIIDILKKTAANTDDLIPILKEIQKKFGYLPEMALQITAEYINIPESTVYAVSTFYPYFKHAPTGKNIIKVCRGTSCHIQGGQRILEETEKQIGIKPGESTDDNVYFLDTVACVGACSHSPNIIINDITYGDMDQEKIIKIFKKKRK